MPNILVNGLALTSTGNPNDANPMNYEFQWIFQNPTALLWADKIVVTPHIRETIANCGYPDSKKLTKALKLIFDIIETNSFLEITNVDKLFSGKGKDIIYDQVEIDRKKLLQQYPEKIKSGELSERLGGLKIESHEYCYRKVAAIYAGLIASKLYDANVFFNEEEYNYLKYLFLMEPNRKRAIKNTDMFTQVFEPIMPMFSIGTYYLVGKECDECTKNQKCEDTYLQHIEITLLEALKWRDYEEIIQLREVVNDIVNKYSSSEEINHVDVSSDLKIKEVKINKLLKKVFPKIERWASFATCISYPIALKGLISNDTFSLITASSIFGASEVIKETLKVIESKHKWVTFLSKNESHDN